MSWLSKTFSSPANALHMLIDPVGGAIGAAKGVNFGSTSSLQSGLTKRGDGSTTAMAPANASDSLAQGAGYYGDPNDPNYGSFTKPFDVQSFYQNLDPSYFFRLQQGQQGLVNSAAAGSGSMSGSAMKDLMDYNQNAASQEYGNSYNRYQTTQGNIFSRLAQMAGLGQSAAAGVGANGVALAGQAGQAVQNAGAAAGAGIVGGANAISNGLGNYAGYQYANQPRQWSGNQPAMSVSP